MTAVTGVLLDEVDVDPPQRLLLTATDLHVVELGAGVDPVGDHDARPVLGERLRQRGPGRRMEVTVSVATASPAKGFMR